MRATFSRRPGPSRASAATSTDSYSAGRFRRTRRSSLPTIRARGFRPELRDRAPFPRPCSGSGIFSTAIYDPATTRQVSGAYVRDRFPNDTIPADRFDPAVRAVLDRYPLPNVFVNGQEATANNYVRHRERDHQSGSIRPAPRSQPEPESADLWPI